MDKKLIIFGNGLGMALDHDHFCLTNAMKRIWDDGTINNDAKLMLGSLKGIQSATGPQNEKQLLATQLALNFLSQFRKKLGKEAHSTWFTPAAINFPDTLRKYIFNVAYNLFCYEIPEKRKTDWSEFLASFVSFTAKTRSHVATLNYDDLLYETIVEGHVVKGKWITLSKAKTGSGNKAPYLRDGFFKGKFRPDTFGWGGSGYYLHLHGTPLFATKDKICVKLNRNEISYNEDTQKRHIVLANHDDKRTIINSSPILKDYWDTRFPKCVEDATEIFLFGYSGADTHLNKLIAEKHTGSVKVIEWIGAGELKERQEYWMSCLTISNDDNIIDDDTNGDGDSMDIQIIQLDDILSFREWATP